MSNVMEVIEMIGKALDMASGNAGAVMDIVNLIIKAYHDIKDSPGDFDLSEFQKRLDALPDYEAE